jgi:hypothetical protein
MKCFWISGFLYVLRVAYCVEIFNAEKSQRIGLAKNVFPLWQSYLVKIGSTRDR